MEKAFGIEYPNKIVAKALSVWFGNAVMNDDPEGKNMIVYLDESQASGLKRIGLTVRPVRWNSVG